MSMADDRVIALSKRKILWVVLTSCGFVLLGAWFLSLDPATIQAQRRFNSPVLVYGIGLASIVLFGSAGVVAVRKLFDKRAGLVLSSSGVIDNSTGVSAGLIPWSEVVGVRTLEVHKQRMLIVMVRDPEKYIRGGGFLGRAMRRANHRMCGSPIAISSSALRIGFPELLTLFQQYTQRYARP